MGEGEREREREREREGERGRLDSTYPHIHLMQSINCNTDTPASRRRATFISTKQIKKIMSTGANHHSNETHIGAQVCIMVILQHIEYLHA